MSTMTPSKEKVGRKPKLTKEIADELARLLKAGHMIDIACSAVGIGERTFHRWMAQGQKETSGPFWQFRQRMEKARAQCEVTLLDTLQQHAKTDWRAAAWMLERMFPTRYGRRLETTLTGKLDDATPSIVPTILVSYLPAVMATPRIAKHDGNGANGTRA